MLSVIVKNMREEIIRLGGTFYFQSCVTDFRIKDGALKAITVNGSEEFETDVTVLAVGHSARDTFERLLERRKRSPSDCAFSIRRETSMPHSTALQRSKRWGRPIIR